jgi:hypothetical protein
MTSRLGRGTSRGHSLLYTLDRRLGGPQGWSGSSVQEKGCLLLEGTEPRFPRYSAYSLLSKLTELYGWKKLNITK